MKKLFALLLALVMACAMLPVMAETADYLGDWFLVEMTSGETTLDPSALGMNVTMTIKEDGTALIVSAYGEVAEETNATWTVTAEGLVVNDGVMDELFVLSDGMLVFDNTEAGMKMVFGREATEVEALPNAIPAEKEADFFGTWELTTVVMGGVSLPATMIGMGMTLTVEEGKITLANEGDEGTVSELESLFSDGVLAVWQEDHEMIVELNDNGSVSITVPLDEENSMILYFEAVK